MKSIRAIIAEKNQYAGLTAFLVALALIQIYFLWNNEVVYEGADNIGHFQIARYGFKYPHLFLDLWGKPVFSILLAPFTLLGFKAAQLFNLLLALLTLIFTWKLSRIIFPKAALFIVVLTAFAPVYFLLMLTTLTEILFSFVLVVSVYLFLKNKFIFSALLLSFIPFVRTEGIIFFPIFALVFVLRRSWWAVPVLAFGTLFYSLVGWFVFDDFLWLINRFPYPTGESVYGSGSLFSFIKKSNYIFGVPLIVLILTGLTYWIYEISKRRSFKDDSFVLFVLIVGCWFGYFAAHSFVWWKGMGGSLGLIRVIGGVIPLAALTGTKGVQFLFEKIKNDKAVYALLVVWAVVQIYMLFPQNRLPLQAKVTERLVAKSAAYLKKENIDGRIFYFDPNIPFLLGFDPYDSSKSVWLWGNNTYPSQFMNFGDILVWDAHFGPNEGRVPFELAESDPFLNKIKIILPVEKNIVLGGNEYEIHIYRKEKEKKQYSFYEKFTRSMDMRTISSSSNSGGSDLVFLELKKEDEFSPSMIVHASELAGKDIYEMESEIHYKSKEPLVPGEVLLVASVENGSEVLHYFTVHLEWGPEQSRWEIIKLNKRFAGNLPDSALLKFYVWNRGRKNIIVKELSTQITGY